PSVSLYRSLVARVSFATGVPLGVYFTSGSFPRFPMRMTLITLFPAMRSSLDQWPVGWDSVVRFGQYTSFDLRRARNRSAEFRIGKGRPYWSAGHLPCALQPCGARVWRMALRACGMCFETSKMAT